jgi:transcriptional regulator with XRE-family HTH domain
VIERQTHGTVRRKTGPILRAMATRRPKKKTSTFATELGARLKALRDKRGLTQQQLGDRLKAAPSRISRYESGGAVPEAETLVTLATVLEVSLDELLLGRASGTEDDGVRDVRLRERMRELEKVDRKYRDAAIEVIDAFVVKGIHEATAARLQGGGKR